MNKTVISPGKRRESYLYGLKTRHLA